MDTFQSVLQQLRAHKQFRNQRIHEDVECARLDSELRARLREERKPLCLIAATSGTVFYKGSPFEILQQFAKCGEQLHPASLCLSVKTVLRSIRKHNPNERRPKKRRKKEEEKSSLLVS